VLSDAGMLTELDASLARQGHQLLKKYQEQESSLLESQQRHLTLRTSKVTAN
jgi:hypothetical protein